MSLYQYKPPSRLRRWFDLLRDVPLLLVDGFTEDDPRFLQVGMTLFLVLCLLALAIYVAAWVLR